MPTPKLGIDISKDHFDVALQWQAEEVKPKQQQYVNREVGFVQLAQWLAHQGARHVHAVMEATGSYGLPLARFLVQHGHSVSIVTPSRITAFAKSEQRRTKTDRSDAALIARFAFSQRRKLHAWTPPSATAEQLLDLQRSRAGLRRTAQQQRNRLSSGPHTPAVQQALEKVLVCVEEQVQQVESAQVRLVESATSCQQQVELLDSIIGIGAVTARLLVAELPPISTFASIRAFAAYLAVVPQERSSGKRVRAGSIGKMGRLTVRDALYYPALTAMRYNPPIRAFAQRLLARGKPKQVVIVACMRKLAHQIYAVLKSGQPFDARKGLSPTRSETAIVA
jgi:transposase